MEFFAILGCTSLLMKKVEKANPSDLDYRVG